MSSRRSRFVGNTVSLAVATAVSTVLTLVQMKILAAYLPLALFGLFASLRGLSLLVSILAANGFPQALVRFLPEHAARGERAVAVRASVIAIVATLGAGIVMLAGMLALRGVFFRQVPDAELNAPLIAWFAVTTLAVALKLVLYGGFNGLRRFGSQTVLETLALAVQAAWMWHERSSLDLVRLFEIVGLTSAVSALIAVPWYWARLSSDVERGEAQPPTASYARYWAGAVGLSVVAIAFSDVDRWVLSNVLALEVLSLFHVASRIVRLANRFIAVPVLTLQPEITRIRAEGRGHEVDLVTSAFFKASVMMGAFAAAGIAACANPLIELASGSKFLGAHMTLILMAASIPLTAMTAPLTAVMKALDGVRAAFYCDLAWACVYVGLMLLFASSLGLVGTGWAQLAASAVQFVIALRLAKVRPTGRDAFATFVRCIVCAAVAFAPMWWLFHRHYYIAFPVLVSAPVIFVMLARRMHVLADAERERVRAVLARRGVTPALMWFVP
ncbi:MAG TPA: lipopolysaccharide biosynthesis protein [Candidatus Krumholzibacteria bacterium]|nr:lipopolysaccharide biosynthesis protein [Candidatus Krumholzibacteria bacterium]